MGVGTVGSGVFLRTTACFIDTTFLNSWSVVIWTLHASCLEHIVSVNLSLELSTLVIDFLVSRRARKVAILLVKGVHSMIFNVLATLCSFFSPVSLRLAV
jgi:hypothetical protein